MGTERDFSSSAKENLYASMRDIEDENQLGLFDWISDFSIPEDIASYQEDIAAYHRSILDKKNTSAAQLDAIWTNVYEVDANSAQNFQKASESIASLCADFQKLADALNPQSPSSVNGVPMLLRGSDWLTFASAASERAADLKMQEQYLALLEEERFSRAVWDAATEEERKALLQKFYVEVQGILGTSAEVELHFGRLGLVDNSKPRSQENTYRGGQYLDSENRVEINTDMMMDSELGYQSYRLIAHELRHCYQYETTSNSWSHNVSKITREIWANNQLPENIKSVENGEDEYRTQPIEWDAYGFAGGQKPGLASEYPGSWESSERK